MVACEVRAGSKPVTTGNGSGPRNNSRLMMCAWHRLLKSSSSSPVGRSTKFGAMRKILCTLPATRLRVHLRCANPHFWDKS